MDGKLRMDSHLTQYTNFLSIKSREIVDVLCINNSQQHILIEMEVLYV